MQNVSSESRAIPAKWRDLLAANKPSERKPQVDASVMAMAREMAVFARERYGEAGGSARTSVATHNMKLFADRIDALLAEVEAEPEEEPTVQVDASILAHELARMLSAVEDSEGPVDLWLALIRVIADLDAGQLDAWQRTALEPAEELLTREAWLADYLRDLHEAWTIAAGLAGGGALRLSLGQWGFGVHRKGDDGAPLHAGDDPLEVLRAVEVLKPTPDFSAMVREELETWLEHKGALTQGGAAHTYDAKLYPRIRYDDTPEYHWSGFRVSRIDALRSLCIAVQEASQ